MILGAVPDNVPSDGLDTIVYVKGSPSRSVADKVMFIELSSLKDIA